MQSYIKIKIEFHEKLIFYDFLCIIKLTASNSKHRSTLAIHGVSYEDISL